MQNFIPPQQKNFASPDLDLGKTYNALMFASLVVGTLCVTHLLTVVYIGYHDLRGQWDKYSLKAHKNTLQTYTSHSLSFLADMFLILFPSLTLYGYFYDAPLWTPVVKDDESILHNTLRVVLIVVSSCTNNVINRLWAAFAHWSMHASPMLYKHVHKKHHTHSAFPPSLPPSPPLSLAVAAIRILTLDVMNAVADLCAMSSWQDSYCEFFFMEVFGTFLFASLFNPLPIASHVLLAAYNGIGAAIDHSAFYIPGTLIDGRYHFDHHLLGTWNYAEMETIDWYFGTLKVWKVDPDYLKAPRLRAERQRKLDKIATTPQTDWKEAKQVAPWSDLKNECHPKLMSDELLQRRQRKKATIDLGQTHHRPATLTSIPEDSMLVQALGVLAGSRVPRATLREDSRSGNRESERMQNREELYKKSQGLKIEHLMRYRRHALWNLDRECT